MRLSRLLPLLFMLAVTSCTCATAPKKAEEPLRLRETAFAALPGWQADRLSEALVPLARSCDRILKKDPASPFGDYGGAYADWQAICSRLPAGPDDALARGFFEANFTPYEIWGGKGRDGLFTGYYEPVLHGAPEKGAPYLIPLYARPDDLVAVNLGDFKSELKGQSIMGRVRGGSLVPYFTRAEIEKGAIGGQPKVVWVDNAVDAFYLQIQGSGQVALPDGQVLRVGYAAANGRAYTAIGRELIRRGALDAKDVSMQSIRAWLEAHPQEAADVMDVNQSFVFFRRLEGDGPLGAEGVALTPRRSLAVDRHKIPYGAPVFLDAAAPSGDGRLQRLMVAQDTGGAIAGSVRGDFFWGAGEEAAQNAGVMKSAGRDYILLPKTARVPEKYLENAWHAAPGAAGGPAYNM